MFTAEPLFLYSRALGLHRHQLILLSAAPIRHLPFKARLHASNDSVDPGKPEEDSEVLPTQDIDEQHHREAHLLAHPSVPVGQVQIQQSHQRNDTGKIETRHGAPSGRVVEEEMARRAPRLRLLRWQDLFDILLLRGLCLSQAVPAGREPVLKRPCKLRGAKYGWADTALDDEVGSQPSHTVTEGHQTAEHHEAGIPEQTGGFVMMENQDKRAAETGVDEVYAQEEELELNGGSQMEKSEGLPGPFGGDIVGGDGNDDEHIKH
ncbi:hypothetical protein MMC15_008425 [Xylographa vitiligo]|nr:hypothetical protein [Xylographa vitiligo]